MKAIRKKIYEEAAERVFNENNFYCCTALNETSHGIYWENMIEFDLFCPFDYIVHSSPWFHEPLNRNLERSQRIFCLLLCAEMCND